MNDSFLVSTLTTLDWIVIATSLSLTFFSAYLAYKHRDTSSGIVDYILMGRRLSLPLFVTTLMASWYGGIFGVTKITFEDGIYNFLIQGVFWYITYIIFALFLVKKIRSFNAVTLPHLVLKMVGPKSAKLSAVFNVLNVVPVTYAISLGIIIQLLTGYSIPVSIGIGVAVAILYSAFGGFRAVVYSDFIQSIFMCVGVALVLVYSISEYSFLPFLKANLPETHFKILGGYPLSSTLVWGFIALSTLVDPNFYQRCFAAKSEKVASMGILISTFIWMLFDMCTTVGALYAKAVLPEAASKTAYLQYSIELLPSGFRGLFLAAIISTIASTLDSYIFLASTTLSHDLGPEKWKNKSYFHYLNILLVGILAIILALIFSEDIPRVWKTLGSYSAACLLFPILFTYVYKKKVSDTGFFLSALCSAIGISLWEIANPKWLSIDSFYIGLFISISILLLSCLTAKQRT